MQAHPDFDQRMIIQHQEKTVEQQQQQQQQQPPTLSKEDCADTTCLTMRSPDRARGGEESVCADEGVLMDGMSMFEEVAADDKEEVADKDKQGSYS